jgi:hypothetical protein
MTATDKAPPSAVDWAAVRLAYDTTETPLRILSEQFGFSLSTWHHRRRREGWTTRRARAALAPKPVLPKPRPAVDWAKVRFDYEKGEISVDDICARHRIGGHRLQKRKRDEGWEPRRANYPKAFGAGGTVDTTESLKALVEGALAKLAADGGLADKIDLSDPLRALHTLLHAFQKLRGMQEQDRIGRLIIDDASRLALARRLEALANAWENSGSADHP